MTGWWAISGDSLLAMLRRAHAGENPDLIYAEEYANSKMETTPEVPGVITLLRLIRRRCHRGR